MPSLQQSFDELRQRLKHGRGLNQASDDPIYYLVFHPEQMIEVKRNMKQWTAKLQLEGWNVNTFSMIDAIHEFFSTNDLRDLWLQTEAEDPLDFDTINKTLTEALTRSDTIKKNLEEKLQSLAGVPNAILLVTDLEALHPYLRVGSLEQRLQGRFTVPTVILYPGIRSGRSTLRFLGIYPEDGSYRSIHIGG